LASAIITATGAIETHGGYQFESRFSANASPETKAIKVTYETAAAKQASIRLQDQVQATGIAHHCLDKCKGQSLANLYALKDCITADNDHNFFNLLAEDIKEANAFWDQVIRESTADRTQWRPARSVSICPWFADSARPLYA
jgi:hypothetical protein